MSYEYEDECGLQSDKDKIVCLALSCLSKILLNFAQ